MNHERTSLTHVYRLPLSFVFTSSSSTSHLALPSPYNSPLGANICAYLFLFFVAFLYSGSSIHSFHYITIAPLRFIFRQFLSFISSLNRDLILLRTFISIYTHNFCLLTTAKDNIAYVSTQVIQNIPYLKSIFPRSAFISSYPSS